MQKQWADQALWIFTMCSMSFSKNTKQSSDFYKNNTTKNKECKNGIY
jgi:hypothetical protein